MEIPKKVDELINKRRELGEELLRVSGELDKWLMANGIEPHMDDWLTGCAIYCDPGSAELGVREAIINHKSKENMKKRF